MAKKETTEHKRSNTLLVDPNELVIVGLDTDHKSDKEHDLYDKRIHLPVDERLVKNMMIYGFTSVVLVKRDGNKLVVVAGRQRIKAAREANKRLEKEGKETFLVEVKVKTASPSTLYGVMVSENEVRTDDDILLKAEKAQRLLDMGKDEEEVAITFGVTTQAVRNWTSMLNCSSDVLKAVKTGMIKPTAAASLASLSHDEQKEKLAEIVAKGGATVAEVQAEVRNTRRSRTNGASDTPAAETNENPPLGKKAILKLAKYLKTVDQEYVTEEIQTLVRGMRMAVGHLSLATVANLNALMEEAKEEVKLGSNKPPKEPKAKRGGTKKAGAKKGGKGGKKPPPRVRQLIGS